MPGRQPRPGKGWDAGLWRVSLSHRMMHWGQECRTPESHKPSCTFTKRNPSKYLLCTRIRVLVLPLPTERLGHSCLSPFRLSCLCL